MLELRYESLEHWKGASERRDYSMLMVPTSIIR